MATSSITPTYISVIEPVTEITLSGSADLSYWQSALQRTGLRPLDINGRAEIIISAIHASFRGLPFREFTISINVSDQPDGGTRNSIYLIHALNSSRLLAFSERVFFKTPYYPAEVAVSFNPAATVSVGLGGNTAYRSILAAGRTAERHEDEVWEGSIYLPADSDKGNVFRARLAGPTDFYSFTTPDSLDIVPTSAAHVFQSLLDSGFSAELWRIREGASHARSRTVNRN